MKKLLMLAVCFFFLFAFCSACSAQTGIIDHKTPADVVLAEAEKGNHAAQSELAQRYALGYGGYEKDKAKYDQWKDTAMKNTAGKAASEAAKAAAEKDDYPVPYQGENGKWGFKDKNGKVIILPKYSAVDDFSEGLAAVDYGGYFKPGREVRSPIEGRTGYTSDGDVAYSWSYQTITRMPDIYVPGKIGYVDKTGMEIVPCKYDPSGYGIYPRRFSEGLAVVKLNGKYGYIDRSGKEIVPCKYDGAKDFSEGLGAVTLDGKWGFISKSGI